ncbi:MAG: hypothetical protein JEZ04_19265 [Spirochaetales bacterium]|nr:hypothetical protein [Spirochaetales bacterium]
MSFLEGKPIWMHWIFYVILCGIIFGISYGMIFLLALRWWVTVLAILSAGMIWGTIVFKQASPAEPEVKKE